MLNPINQTHWGMHWNKHTFRSDGWTFAQASQPFCEFQSISFDHFQLFCPTLGPFCQLLALILSPSLLPVILTLTAEDLWLEILLFDFLHYNVLSVLPFS